MPSRPRPDAASDAVDDVLRGLGLISTERRTYRFLLQAATAAPTTIAQETGQSRGRIYETLRVLAERGFVREEPTQPVRYHAVPLGEVLAVALAANHRRVHTLEQLQETFVHAPVPASARVRADDIAVFSGRRAVAGELRRLLSRSRRRFVLMGGGRVGERLAADDAWLDEVKAAVRRGVRLEMHLPDVGEAARRTLEQALGTNLPLSPATASVPTVWVAAEDASLTIMPQPDDAQSDRGDDVAVAARGTAFADATQREIRLRLGATAAPAPASTSLADLDPTRIGIRFLESLAGSRTEVLGLGPQGWGAFLERGWEATVGVYAAAKGRGVQMRALAADTPQESATLERFGAVWDIRLVSWVPAWLVVVDRKELFQVLPAATGPGGTPLRHSTDPQEVSFYVDLFERLWKQGRPLREATPKTVRR